MCRTARPARRSRRPATAAAATTAAATTAAAGAATVLTGGVAAFQVALAAGAPWGAAAWGGANPGVLPPGLRATSAGSALAHLLLGVTVGSTLVPARRRRGVLTVVSGVMVLGAVLNLVSPSGVERAVWTPVAAALAVLLRLARPAAGPQAEPATAR